MAAAGVGVSPRRRCAADAGGAGASDVEAAPSRRVLVLSPFPPRLDATHGGARAIATTLDGLSRHHRVAVLYLQRVGEAPIDAALEARCDLATAVPVGGEGTSRWRHRARVAGALCRGAPLWVARCWSPAFADVLRRAVVEWRPDVVQAELHVMGQYLRLVEGGAAVRVLTEHEASTFAAGGSRPSLRAAEAWAWARYERAVVAAADAVVVFTERDARAAARLAAGTPVSVIPLDVPVPARASDPLGADPASLLFVGNFMHPPNVDAVGWLVREILPLVRARCPRVTLQIVGDNVPASVRVLAADHVNVVGPVADLGPYYDRAAVVVAPIRLGGGMRVKVLEALAAGKAVVATSLAADGLSATTSKQLVLADSAGSFAAAVAELASSPRQRDALAARARAWACAHLGGARQAHAYGALYERLVAGAVRTRDERGRRLDRSSPPTRT